MDRQTGAQNGSFSRGLRLDKDPLVTLTQLLLTWAICWGWRRRPQLLGHWLRPIELQRRRPRDGSLDGFISAAMMGRDWKWSLGNNFVFISFYGRKFGLEIREMEPIKCREAETKLNWNLKVKSILTDFFHKLTHRARCLAADWCQEGAPQTYKEGEWRVQDLEELSGQTGP